METLEQALEEETRATRFLKIKLWFDLLAQIALLGIVFFYLGNQNAWHAFVWFYFVLGGYQLLSALIHLATRQAFEKRKIYYIQLIVHAGMWGLMTISYFLGTIEQNFAGFAFFGLFFELFLSPAAAITYLVMTIMDFGEYKNR